MDITISSDEKTEEKNFYHISNSLKFICEAIDKGSAALGSNLFNSELTILLKSLNYIERSCIATYFCKLPWNLGSVKVLGSLNHLRVLTATEYILSQTDDEHIQLVLNDFLETEFDLISNLVITGHYDLMVGSKISEYVAESIRRLISDLANDPKLNNFDYMFALNQSVPKEIYSKFLNNHLGIIVAMHQRSTKIAFASFSDWMKHDLEDYVLLSNFYKKAVVGNELEVVKNLLAISTAENFVSWKNYLILLALVTKYSSHECYLFIKKFLKERLKIVAESGSVAIMAHLLLSIRAVLMFRNDEAETYAKWYKLHIADMKFVFDVAEFKNIMSVLTDLVPFEMDEEYLEVCKKSFFVVIKVFFLLQTRMSDAGDCSRLMDNDDDDLFSHED